MEASDYLNLTPEQKQKRHAQWKERKAQIAAGEDPEEIKLKRRAKKALFLLKNEFDGEGKIQLSDAEIEILKAVVVEYCSTDLYFFSKYVLDFDLLTKQTHKRWADNLLNIIRQGRKRVMRLKPRGTYKCLKKGTPILDYGIDDGYNVVPAKLKNQKDFFEEGIEVTFSSGKKHICTKDHLFKTVTGWNPAKPGLRVATVKKIIPSRTFLSGLTNIFWDKIKEVREVGKTEFSAIGSDIENYITPDGIIHHNTTIYGVGFTLWLWACQSPQIRIFYTSSNALLLGEVSDKINQYVGDEKADTFFSFIFGIVKDSVAKNTNDVFNIKGRSGKGFSLILRTSGGSTVGIHPNVVIIDDPCFDGETKVLTKNGYVSIKNIKEGQYVLTRKGYKKVLSSGITKHNAKVKRYDINGVKLIMTSNHKVFVKDKGKVPVSLLENGDYITKFQGETWKYEKLRKGIGSFLLLLMPTRKRNVYNITVEDCHEFVAEGLLVANCDQKDRESEAVREQKKRWLDSITPLLVPFVSPRSQFLFKTVFYIGTVWHMQDLTYHIAKMNKKLTGMMKWDIEVESIYNEDGLSSYPEFMSDEEIAAIKSSISEEFFACQYMNKALPVGLQTFNLSKLTFVREDQVNIKEGQILCIFDPSLGKASSDYPAVWWLHKQGDNLTFIAALDEKIELSLIVNVIAAKNRELGCREMVYENNGIMLVEQALENAHKKIFWHIDINSVHHSSNKHERIVSIQPDLYSGYVRFMIDYEERYPEAMNQIVFYGAYGHDDFPDAAHMGIEYFRQDHFQFHYYTELS